MKKKFFLNSTAVFSILSFGTIVSCGVTQKPQEPKKDPDNKQKTNDRSTQKNPAGATGASNPVNTNSDFETFRSSIANKGFTELFDITGTSFNLDDIKANLTKEQFIDKVLSGDLKISLKNNDTSLNIVNAVAVENQNTAALIFAYKNNSNNLIQFNIDGFVDKNSNSLITKKSNNPSDWTIYHESSQANRYESDMKEYDKLLKPNVQARELGQTAATKAEFDQKAKSLNLATYDRANLLGYTIPKYNEQGEFLGLDMKMSEQAKADSWVDSYGKIKALNSGLARTITNQTYANMALSSYNLKLTNWAVSSREADRLIAKEIFKPDPNVVKYLINMLTNNEIKQDLLTKFDRNNDDSETVEVIHDKAFEQLASEHGLYLARQKYEDEFNKYRRELLFEKINASTLEQKIKDKLITAVKRMRTHANFQHAQHLWESFTPNAGTAWIMDYELTEDGKYPTKWYFATNLHVIDAMDQTHFKNFQLTVLHEEMSSLYNKLRTIPLDDRFKSYDFNDEDSKAITRIFDGRDYLTKDPVDYLADKTFDKKEFIDIAIFEVDFSKTKYTEEDIKFITNNYALKDDRKISFLEYDYLQEYSKIDIPLATNNIEDLKKYDNLYVLGYPKTKTDNWEDYYIDQIKDKTLYEQQRFTYSLWTNASYELYEKPGPTDDARSKTRYELGYGLSYSLGYRTFTDKPGVVDQFLSAPIIGNAPYTSPQDNKEYVAMNLAYMPRRYIPGGGASGSQVRTQDNKVVGIFHSVNQYAGTGLAAAFRSNGFNYQGLFGSYNLPQYDIIYGTGKDQKNSYRDAMKKLNKQNTWLFKNGFELENVPEQYKFKNSN